MRRGIAALLGAALLAALAGCGSAVGHQPAAPAAGPAGRGAPAAPGRSARTPARKKTQTETTRKTPPTTPPPQTTQTKTTPSGSGLPPATATDPAASFAAAAGVAPPLPIETAPDPADPAITWAVEPVAIHGVLWWGTQAGPGQPWRWIPSDLPGALSRDLPTPAYDALQWAYDLHEGAPGPRIQGRVPWASVTGEVSEPVGWDLATSGPPDPGVDLTVWVRSYAYNSVYYGINTFWTRANVDTGVAALGTITPVTASDPTALMAPTEEASNP